MELRTKGWSDFWTRTVNKAGLVPVGEDSWYWVVQFHWVPRDIAFAGEAPQLSVAVTMDGQAVIPVPTRDENDRPPGGLNDEAR